MSHSGQNGTKILYVLSVLNGSKWDTLYFVLSLFGNNPNFGTDKMGQDTEAKWDKTSYLSQMSHHSVREKFRFLGQTNRGQTSYLSLDTKKILVSIFFRVSLSQSVTSRNRQCGVSVATLVCPIYP